jgi:hypothetical protein
MRSIFSLKLTIICLVLSQYSCENTDKKFLNLKPNDFSIIFTILALTTLTIFILIIYILISYRFKKIYLKKNVSKLDNNNQFVGKTALRASFDLDEYFINECKTISIKPSFNNKLYIIPSSPTNTPMSRCSRTTCTTQTNHDRSSIKLNSIREDDDK